MNCEELQRELSLYVDDELSPASRAACNAHLIRCPACRHDLAQTRTLIRELAQMSRPEVPVELSALISNALATESAATSFQQPARPRHEIILGWLRPRLMPYTIGAFTSVILFACLFAALLPYMRVLRQLETDTAQGAPYDRSLIDGPFDVTIPISPEFYASSRVDFSSESPSLNPKGALASRLVTHRIDHR
ncbi:MAG: zf-HC2 domain-containing protein [Pyrinomonadaceae bacterium]